MRSPIFVLTADDPRVADYRAVAAPALAVAGGFVVAEGRFVVERLVAMPRFQVRSLLLNRASLLAMESTIERLPLGTPVLVADGPLIEAITGFDMHRGCLAIADRPPTSTLLSLARSARTLVVLENCANADNIGGVFRNAAAFGVDGVVLSPTCSDPYYRKAIRTSMAAVLSVPFARAVEWPQALDVLRTEGFVVMATTPNANAETLERFASRGRPSRVAVLLGAESRGLTERAMALADVAVRIPISGAVDSLNLAVCAGIVLSRLSEIAVSDKR